MTGFIDAMIERGDHVLDRSRRDRHRRAPAATSCTRSTSRRWPRSTVAGCGVPVAKHGNRAASSSVGSADVLEALGVRLDAPEEVVRACVEGAGIGFLFAPTFHHGAGLPDAHPSRAGFSHDLQRPRPAGQPRARATHHSSASPRRHLLDAMAQVLHRARRRPRDPGARRRRSRRTLARRALRRCT